MSFIKDHQRKTAMNEYADLQVIIQDDLINGKIDESNVGDIYVFCENAEKDLRDMIANIEKNTETYELVGRVYNVQKKLRKKIKSKALEIGIEL